MELIKDFNEQHNYWTVKCSEGHKITSWKEGDDIKDYTSFAIAYCPANANLDIYHCVSDEEDERLMKLQLEELKKEENKEE